MIREQSDHEIVVWIVAKFRQPPLKRGQNHKKETPTEIGASRYCWQLALNTDPPVTKRCEDRSGQQQRLIRYGESGNFGKVDNQKWAKNGRPLNRKGAGIRGAATVRIRIPAEGN